MSSLRDQQDELNRALRELVHALVQPMPPLLKWLGRRLGR